MTPFSNNAFAAAQVQWIAIGAAVLKGFASPLGTELVTGIATIEQAAPFRRLLMMNGHPMTVAMTNCGERGWVNTSNGFGYSSTDPLTGHRWPVMPELFRELATRAASSVGFADFDPNVCIVNRYGVGAELHMHQDRDDLKDRQPIVSVSLGLPATFLFGNQGAGKRSRHVCVEHGDVAVWGGLSRMAYHGIAPIEDGAHPLTRHVRFNLTFRRARVPRTER